MMAYFSISALGTDTFSTSVRDTGMGREREVIVP